ncbi:MAG: tetratricopeptide repeat protein [Candidatus Hodarchaeota archaeon]
MSRGREVKQTVTVEDNSRVGNVTQIMRFTIPAILIISIVLITIVMVSGYDLRTLFETFTPSTQDLQVDFQPVCPDNNDTEHDSLVLIARFDNRGGNSQSPHSYVSSRLSNEFFEENISVREVPVTVKDSNQATILGQHCGATFVIWGWYDEYGIAPHIESIEQIEALCQDPLAMIKLKPVAVSGSSDSYITFVVNDLPNTLAYFLHTISGHIKYNQGDYDEAITFFTQALELDIPTENRKEPELIHFFRGNAYYELGDFQAAYEDWDAAIKLNPDYVNAYI